MKTLSLFIFLFALAGCQSVHKAQENLKHATNVNLREVEYFADKEGKADKLNERVKTITPEKAKDCKKIKDYVGKDNTIDQGQQFAVLYLKHKAKQVEANAVVINKLKKIGDYGYEAHGTILSCPE